MSKLFIDYPNPGNIQEAIDYIRNGGEVWSEFIGDCPEHGCNGCDCCYEIFIDDLENFDDSDVARLHIIK